jgi:dTDP-4-amino-4,6-dideoxygalactose transaminase
MTTGEGGMAVTNDLTLAKRMNLLRSHGITRDPAEMTTSPEGGWYYQQIALGFNYRMTDMQAALGLSQLERIDEFVGRRNHLADRYDRLLANLPIGLPARRDDTLSAFHLYAIRIDEKAGKDRRYVFEALRDLGIGVQVHYIPVYMQPYYHEQSDAAGELPEAGQYYKATISLPLFHSLSEDMQDRVIAALTGVLK